ncbi:MAG: Gfo/Idh/MocA family oxidoreductase [Candidatus Levyibacteriota bacterium]
MSNLKKVPTIGLVGLGNQGKKHLDCILGLQDKKLVKLVGLCDTSIEQLPDSIETPFYVDYRDLYSKTKPDIVVIATPNYLHKQMSVDALNKGMHVIKEKPLAINYLDAYEMLRVSQKTGKLLLTTQQRFYSPLFLKAKNIIPSLGQIVNFSYRFTLNDTTRSWRWDLEKAGGGSWLNMGWHAVAIIQWLIGDVDSIGLTWKVNGKRAWDYKTDHSSFARVVARDNAIGSIFLSCAYPKKEETLKIVFSKGILYLSRDTLKVFARRGKQQNYYSSLDERSIYTAQLEELLKKIRNNNYDQTQDLKTMATIQAGLNSAYSKSSLIDVKGMRNQRNNTFYLANTVYADF